MVKLKYTITEDDYVKANKLFTRPAKALLLVYAGLLFALLASAFNADSVILKLGAVGCLVGAYAGHMTVRHLLAPWKARRQYRVYQAAQESVVVELQPEGLLFKSASGEGLVAWSRMRRWREDEELLLIYQAPEVYHILPKRVGEPINKVREALVQHGVARA